MDPQHTSTAADRRDDRLAAAYAIERKLAAGSLAGFQDAADLLGASPSWASHVLNLLNLKPEIQEAILAGEMVAHEKLEQAARVLEWEKQRRWPSGKPA